MPDFSFTLLLQAKDGTRFKETYTCGGGALGIGSLRSLVKATLEETEWIVVPVGEDKLVVISRKDSPVEKFDVKGDKLAPEMLPKIRRLPQE